MNQRSKKVKTQPPRAEQEAELRRWCAGRGVELRITNERQHWQFRRDPSILNWWPSTEWLRDVANKDFYRVLLCDLGTFLASAFPPLEEPPFEGAGDEDDIPAGDTHANNDDQNTWDYFAANALASVFAGPGASVFAGPGTWREKCAAEFVANVADAMMAERARRKR